jgi:hypothetical protein
MDRRLADLDGAREQGRQDVLQTAKSHYDQLRGYLNDELDTINANFAAVGDRIDGLTPLPKLPIELDLEERGRMQMAWPQSVCPYCQHAHSGICPRVRRAEFDSAGRVVRVWFWPDGKWSIPDDALSVEDVFGAPHPAAARPGGERANDHDR